MNWRVRIRRRASAAPLVPSRSKTSFAMSRSVRIHEFGGPEVLKIEEVTVPAPGLGEVRLKIKAIGLNRTEVTLRSGRSGRPPFPTQIGFEAAGEIEALGPDVRGFAIGDRVALIPAYSAFDYGLYGEVSLAPARSLAPVAAGTDWQAAAATWVAFSTAWAGLIDIARLSAGQVVLISAASSSVGLAAIQMARKVGAVPIALTRTSAKAQSLRANGAADVIATEEQDVTAEVLRLTSGKGADVVFDPVVGEGFAKLVEATAVGGVLVVYGGLGGPSAAFPVMPMLGRRLSIHGFGLPSTTRDDAKLTALKQFVDEGLALGELHPIISKVFAFNEIVEAHRYLEQGEQIGKIVVAT
jgi:NADPH:quinone reductase-like Zn-dependent oxidoreductase